MSEASKEDKKEDSSTSEGAGATPSDAPSTPAKEESEKDDEMVEVYGQPLAQRSVVNRRSRP